MPDQTAETTADMILNEVISRYGCPLDIHSDRGSNYRSNFFRELCNLLEIRKTQTTATNPKCNGKVEKFNKTLVRMVRAYLKGQQREWDRNLGCLASAYISAVHETTGFTPNMLMLSREGGMPTEVMLGEVTQNSEILSYGDYTDKIRERMKHAHEVARQHLQVRLNQQKVHYDSKSFLLKNSVGDYVWYLTERREIGENPKLYMPFERPYLVVDRLTDLDLVIQDSAKGKYKIVNHNKPKSYRGNIRYNSHCG